MTDLPSPSTANLIKSLDALRESIDRSVERDRLAFDVPTAARLLSISHRKLRDLIAEGRVRVVRIDRRVLVPRDALVDLLEGAAR